MTSPTALPFGMRDLKLTRYTDGSGTILDTVSIDLPNMQTLSFSEAEDSTTLRGDDKTVAVRGQGASVEWELEAGGISFDAWSIFTGGLIIETGLTPNRQWRLRKFTTDNRPYFRIEGKMVSDSGGDVHAIIYRARVTESVEGEFADGEFFITSASGEGLPLINNEDFDLLYDIVYNETAVNIPLTGITPNPTGQAAPTTLAAPSATATTVTLTWVAAAGAGAGSDYQVSMRTIFGDWFIVDPANTTTETTTGAVVTGLVTATQYQFRVRANTAANGPSDWTAPVNKTTS